MSYATYSLQSVWVGLPQWSRCVSQCNTGPLQRCRETQVYGRSERQFISLECCLQCIFHSNLCKLNIESNELIGFPPTLLSLPLTHLFVSGNYTHHALWRENSRTPPQVHDHRELSQQSCHRAMGYFLSQTLIDMCCVSISASTTDHTHLPTWTQDILQDRYLHGVKWLLGWPHASPCSMPSTDTGQWKYVCF